MYCPQCSQQQVSNEVRFCSRCGFLLSGVAELLASGGVPRVQEASPPQMSPRRRGVRQGAALFLTGAVLVPILAVLADEIRLPDLFVALGGIICFLGGIVRMLYAAIFEEGGKSWAAKVAPPYVAPSAPLQVSAPARHAALPPQQSAPVGENMPRRAVTAQFLEPPSVVEETTRLLDKQPDLHA